MQLTLTCFSPKSAGITLFVVDIPGHQKSLRTSRRAGSGAGGNRTEHKQDDDSDLKESELGAAPVSPL